MDRLAMPGACFERFYTRAEREEDPANPVLFLRVKGAGMPRTGEEVPVDVTIMLIEGRRLLSTRATCRHDDGRLDCTPGEGSGSFDLRPTENGIRFEAGAGGLVLETASGPVNLGGDGPALLSHYLVRMADDTCL